MNVSFSKSNNKSTLKFLMEAYILKTMGVLQQNNKKTCVFIDPI